eukprot:357838-Chlamydomonas_euryale.AAC.7
MSYLKYKTRTKFRLASSRTNLVHPPIPEERVVVECLLAACPGREHSHLLELYITKGWHSMPAFVGDEFMGWGLGERREAAGAWGFWGGKNGKRRRYGAWRGGRKDGKR